MTLDGGARWIVLTACAALIGGPPAHASLYAVTRSDADIVTVLNPQTVESLGGKLHRAWDVSVHRSIVSGGPRQPGYVRTLNEYDCAGRRIRWRSLSVYSRFGVMILQKDNADPAWNPIDDGSEGDAALRVICDGAGRSGMVSASSVSQLVLALMRTWDEAAPLPPLQPTTPVTPARARAAKTKPRPHKAH
ncbi:surface-adhesin E family protein [Phenylobacterium sp.]|uniref:surface-adhesin E family protein n=1 Tax=Phenylobacterium sp. TaxID=1871053 RepID=UPI00286B8B47|nr:surface-adhesin E family protein [Phenylobacterium sp.]